MCSNPIAHDENVFACRVCNQCIKTRKNDWVARAMAEKATSAETVVLHLTYRNKPNGDMPEAAKAFRYSDIQNMLKGLREAYFTKYNARNEIRYIVAGEQGSKKGRVHWHLVLFADRPISALGKWETFTGKPLKELQHDKMNHWSLWPHGHVKPQIPNQGGLQYVLKYALKDQFNVVKSKGTMRESKAEVHAASMFRMSKHPQIGMRFIQRKLDRLEARGATPVSLDVRIPEYQGFWFPKRQIREYFLERCLEINKKRKQETGKNAAQWNALLMSVESEINDWETLYYGPQTQEYIDHTDSLERRRATERGELLWYEHNFAIRKRCGGEAPCASCFSSLSKKDKKDCISYQQAKQRLYQDRPIEQKQLNFAQWTRRQKVVNPYCANRHEVEQTHAFTA